MARIGITQPLTVLHRARQGAYLDGAELGEILLPNREAPEGLESGDSVNVFVYHDGEGRLVATATKPRAQLGEVAFLNVVSVSRVGAFLEWGLAKDLLLPFGEQRGQPEEGRSQLVKIIQNHDGRLVASAQLDRHLEDTATCYQQGDEVVLVVAHDTDIGYKVVVDFRYWGLINLNEIRAPLKRGQRLTGYIQRLRPDDRLSISLNAPGAAKSDEFSEKVLAQLEKNDGFLPLNDKSSPEEIFSSFRVSKAAFKQTIGKLYKARKIRIEKDGIYLS
ncbi:MAG: S1-like domain-containing RNA-binding protein [Alcanivoracaceae bacterium]|nr:S1-like domain-containing RNA-binding protein [Alcanivoracaceae bacterium]